MNDNNLLGCFISIPKCASKTILNMFELGYCRDNHFNEKSKQCIIYENHQRLKVLESKYNLENKYTFTFVRHPYQRVKSWYYYHKNSEPYKSQTLNQWIKNGCETNWTIQNKTNWKKEKISPLLQYNFIDGNKKLNYIGKIENFKEDCKNIISELNLILEANKYPKKIRYKNIKVNKAKRKKNEIITDESKDIIYNLFKKDFDYFRYDR